MALEWRTVLAALASLAIGIGGCGGPKARSPRSFDEIEALARGKSAEQIAQLLGEPDTRQMVFDADERWIWWNYTFLDGRDCPPEWRGRVVHLEIVFRNPRRPGREASDKRPYSEWRIDDPFGINYRAPWSDG